jgi:hypothetical protein
VQSLPTVPRWASESLGRLSKSTARIAALESEDGATILGLEFPDRTTAELRVDALPASRASDRELGEGAHPIAVLATMGGASEPAFSVLASTRRGPVRVSVGAATALWLLQTGIHGVVRCGR